MSASDLHSAWARLFVRGLVTAGVTRAVVSPGSRSTPLALALASEPGVTLTVAVDERAAGFFALGQARVTGAPSALVCTSGSAGAHYLPALIEARRSGVPLVAVTADRPWEAADVAAQQTVDQVKLYGDHVVHYAELGLPDASPLALRAAVRVGAQAAALARWPEPGPVHVNARFRKPLEPVRGAGVEPWEAAVGALLRAGAPAVYAPREAPTEEALGALEALCRGTERGLIVAGPSPSWGDLDGLRAAVRALSLATGWPVLAEATSQLRFGLDPEAVPVCGGFDAVWRDERFLRGHAPEAVLSLGAPPTSGAWQGYLDAHPECAHWVLAPRGWNDPGGSARGFVLGDPGEVIAALASRLGPARVPGTRWARDFVRASEAVERCARGELSEGALTEGAVARAVVDALPDGATLVVGNSNPVRDLELYAPPARKALRVVHQRGASGIDGLVSGAAGAMQASRGPVALLVGDVSFLHDLSGLDLARAVGGPLVLVVVQNDGGRIFEGLPLGRDPLLAGPLEALFVTPRGLSFAPAAELFKVAHQRVETPSALALALREGLSMLRCSIVEAVVPPRDGAARRAALWRAVGTALREVSG